MAFIHVDAYTSNRENSERRKWREVDQLCYLVGSVEDDLGENGVRGRRKGKGGGDISETNSSV